MSAGVMSRSARASATDRFTTRQSLSTSSGPPQPVSTSTAPPGWVTTNPCTGQSRPSIPRRLARCRRLISSGMSDRLVFRGDLVPYDAAGRSGPASPGGPPGPSAAVPPGHDMGVTPIVAVHYPPEAAFRSRDKLLTTVDLVAAGIPVVPTAAFDEPGGADLAALGPGELIVKPARGVRGQGIATHRSAAALTAAWRRRPEWR